MKVHELKGNKHPKKGKYGVEIEVESNSTPFGNYLTPKEWYTTEDGSLRNLYNVEYVLNGPKSYAKTVEAIENLQGFFEEIKAVNVPSIRTGVHVHLNVTDRTLTELSKIVAVYLTLERVLSKYCGEDRDGNLFCLRVCDCPSMALYISAAMSNASWMYSFNSEFHKYSALNLSTISKHGSIEFRTLKTPKVLTDIIEWIDIIEAIEKYALSLENLYDIPYEISYYSFDVWAKKVLGDELFEKVDYLGLEKDIKSDMRNIQSIYHMKIKDEPYEKPEELEADLNLALDDLNKIIEEIQAYNEDTPEL